MKLHQRNGFEFHHQKEPMGGYWVHEWKYRKIGCPVFIDVPGAGVKAPKRAEVIAFLDDREKASDYYDETLSRLSNVSAAEQEWHAAKMECEKFKAPDFDWRGNNPDKGSRMMKNAREALEMAEIRLQKARVITELLEKERCD